jgi:hypothetical protein
MKECDALELNNTTAEVSLTRNIPMITSGAFLRFFHIHMIDSPMGVVLLGSNRNRVGSMGRGRCSYSRLIDTSAQIGASIGVMSLFTTVIAPTVSLLRVLGNLGPLNTLIPSNRSLQIVGALNHLTLRGRESLSNCLRPW